MAHKRRSKVRKRQLPDPTQVLEGIVEARVEDLFDLIHEVNPTRRRLPAAETARRYRLKSRLQSLLIRRFGDEHLAVVREPGGAVSLEHLSGVRDACHTRLSELEPDARAWAQRRLDVEAAPASETTDHAPGDGRAAGLEAGGEAASADQLVARGARAMRDYDYEQAERHLTLAFERSGGAARAARPLLELLVGVLGLDEEALALEPRLSADARRQPAVRALLALATARRGGGDRALRLLDGADGAQAVDAFAVLAKQAVRDRDPRAASRHLEAIVERDPADSRVAALRAEIATLRAEKHRPAEEAVLERRRRDGALAAEADARALLERWPESQGALRVIREAAELRRRSAIARSLERGRRAMAEERFEQAARYFRQARDDGSDQPDLPDLLERAERRGRRRREAALLASALERFDDGERADALAAYLALPAKLRPRLRRRLADPAPAWLDALGAPSSGPKAQAAVAAVLALEQASVSLAGGEAAAALERLAPHLKTLKGLGEARAVHEEASAAVAAERRKLARATLDAARQALDAARFDDAARRLAEIEPGALGQRGRAEAQRLRARLDHERTVALLAAESERRASGGDLLGAIDQARELHRLAAGEDEREAGRRRLAELRQRLRQAWRLEVADEAAGELAAAPARAAARGGLDDFPAPTAREFASVWLDADAGELALANVQDRWLFLRLVDLARGARSGAVITRLSLRTPEPLGLPLTVSHEGDRLSLFGGDGAVLEIERRTWEIRSWRSFTELLPERAELRCAVPVYPGRSSTRGERDVAPDEAWLESGTDRQLEECTATVVDLRSWRLGRDVAHSWPLPIVGLAERRVVTAPLLGGGRLHGAHGAPVVGGLLPLGGRLRSAAAAPDGVGLLITDLRGPRGDPRDEIWIDRFFPRLIKDRGEGLFLLWVEPEAGAKAYRLRASLQLESSGDGAYPIATDVDRGLSFVLVDSESRRPAQLRAYRDAPGLEEVYRVAMPPDTDLIQDRFGRGVVAVAATGNTLDVLPLGPEAPRLESWSEARAGIDQRLPITLPPFDCDPHPAGFDGIHQSDSVQKLFRGLPVQDFLRQVNPKDPADMARLQACTLLLHSRADDPEARQLQPLLAALAKMPRRSEGAFLAASQLVKLEDWDAVLEALKQARPRTFSGRFARHYYHLLGLARLHHGQAKEAHAAFRKGLRHPGDCRLEPLFELTRPMAADPKPAAWDHRRPLVRQLLGAIRTADRAIEAGDADAALSAVRRPTVWRNEELQSTARMARVFLGTPAPSPRERFFKRHALALFRAVHAQGRRSRRWQIFLPDLSWQEDRLDKLADDAEAWLEGTSPL